MLALNCHPFIFALLIFDMVNTHYLCPDTWFLVQLDPYQNRAFPMVQSCLFFFFLAYILRTLYQSMSRKHQLVVVQEEQRGLCDL